MAEKHAGGRPPGAPNKGKTVAELTALLEAATKTESGEIDPVTEITEVVSAPADEIVEGVVDTPAPVTPDPAPVVKGETLEIVPDKEPPEIEVDSFSCGNCGGKLDSALPVCPHCGVKLGW